MRNKSKANISKGVLLATVAHNTILDEASAISEDPASSALKDQIAIVAGKRKQAQMTREPSLRLDSLFKETQDQELPAEPAAKKAKPTGSKTPTASAGAGTSTGGRPRRMIANPAYDDSECVVSRCLLLAACCVLPAARCARVRLLAAPPFRRPRARPRARGRAPGGDT